jgi:tetratricopeptide (TPR) repeat protein
MRYLRRLFFVLVFLGTISLSQEVHEHGVPQELGTVSFPITCAAAVQDDFNRGVALLHSFAYRAAANSFAAVAKADPGCAMAHWGIAMTYFRQLWEPPILPATISSGQSEIKQAQQIGTSSKRERQYINALVLIYEDPSLPYSARALNYERAMRNLVEGNKQDVEAQVFYALALLANASPADKTHAMQKQAVEVLEPLNKSYPQHPGIPHYLIHACDNAELAPKGLAAARAYSQIAPSAPHALHMPSHIYTRLGLWTDSINSNIAAKDAARQQGDVGEELHAMDYLVYAYLQTGEDDKAHEVIGQLKIEPELKAGDFKASYAATAMPVRYAVERGRWEDAAALVVPSGAPPQVAAVAVWARGLGLVHLGRTTQAQAEIDRLRQMQGQLRTAGNSYWATQTEILQREVMAWAAQEQKKPTEAVVLLQSAADEEDAIEKLPVTPGPILPAREQLGYLLLEQDQASPALKQFNAALANAPGRWGTLQGVSQAQELLAKQ